MREKAEVQDGFGTENRQLEGNLCASFIALRDCCLLYLQRDVISLIAPDYPRLRKGAHRKIAIIYLKYIFPHLFTLAIIE
jgi:hypothetical protein